MLSVGESCLCTERVSACVCFTKGWLLDALVACCVSDDLLNIYYVLFVYKLEALCKSSTSTVFLDLG